MLTKLIWYEQTELNNRIRINERKWTSITKFIVSQKRSKLSWMQLLMYSKAISKRIPRHQICFL